MLGVLCLLFALTRAEIIERFRAPPAIKLDGFVQVIADCPSDMRREYQLPVAGYVAGVCRSLYGVEMLKPRRFAEPGIVVYVGEMRTNVTNVVSRVAKHADGTPYTRIYLPAPGYSDRRALALATARAYFLSVHGETVDDARARRALLSSDPALRAEDACERIAAWAERGVCEKGMDDEAYLKLSRKVLWPGHATAHEISQFASRLWLYPLTYAAPFCGAYDTLDFARAVQLRKRDVNIRLAALIKSRQILIFGAGRGEGMQAAADAYALFLAELGRDEKSDEELFALLARADDLLKGVH